MEREEELLELLKEFRRVTEGDDHKEGKLVIPAQGAKKKRYWRKKTDSAKTDEKQRSETYRITTARSLTDLFSILFSSRRVGPEGQLLFKDYGDWGSYDGGVDDAGNRQGRGTMTYDSGSRYEGGFVDDKFECEKGSYRWAGGDRYEGAWKDGGRDGRGRTLNLDGSIDYSWWDDDSPKGEGVRVGPIGRTLEALTNGETDLERESLGGGKLILLLLLLLCMVLTSLLANHAMGRLGQALGLGPSPLKRVLYFYEKHNPGKLNEVPAILDRYDYPALVQRLERKYGDHGYFAALEQKEQGVHVLDLLGAAFTVLRRVCGMGLSPVVQLTLLCISLLLLF